MAAMSDVSDEMIESAAVLRIVTAVRDECERMVPQPTWAEVCVRIARAAFREGRRDPAIVAEIEAAQAALNLYGGTYGTGDDAVEDAIAHLATALAKVQG